MISNEYHSEDVQYRVEEGEECAYAREFPTISLSRSIELFPSLPLFSTSSFLFGDASGG